MLSTLLIRLSKGKVTGVMGTITGCGQGSNESASGRGEINGYEIMEGYDELEATERLTFYPNQTRARLPSPTVFNCQLSQGELQLQGSQT